MYVDSEDERMCYLYDYYIEMHLTTVNGKALEKLISTPKGQQKESINFEGLEGMSSEAVKK